MSDSNGHRPIHDRPRSESPPGAIDLRPGSKVKVDLGTVAKAVGGVLLAGVAVAVFYFTAVVRPDQLEAAQATATAHIDAVATASAKADERIESRAASVEQTLERHADSISRMSGQLDLLVDLEVERAKREGPRAQKAVLEAVRKNPAAGVAPQDLEPEDTP